MYFLQRFRSLTARSGSFHRTVNRWLSLSSFTCTPTIFIIVSALLMHGCAMRELLGYAAEPNQTEKPVLNENVDALSQIDEECSVTPEVYSQLVPINELNLWDRVRAGYRIPPHSNKRIDAEASWYIRNPNYMKRVTHRGRGYLFHIVDHLEQRQMPLEIALLPIVESAFDPFAYSHGRASGMWQIVPGTGKMLGLKQNWWYDGRRDVVASTNAALNYLEKLNKRFNGDWLLALAAYNSGAGNVSKAIRKNKRRGKPTDFWHLELPRETKSYVPRLLALSKLISAPNEYQLELQPIANDPYFAAIHVGSQIDLAQAAELAGLDMATFYHLNPGFNRWATDPQGPHELLVPFEQAEQFAQKIAAIPKSERVEWKRYTIRSGDSLSTIAKRNRISVASLKNINQLRGNTIRAGKTLMIPTATKEQKHYSHSFEQRVAKRYAAVEKSESGKQISYTVKEGDSFWVISRRFKVSISKLARWNSMAPRDTLKPGQVLKIWTAYGGTPLEKSGVIRKVSYKVRSGDSLAKIAQKFRLRTRDIVKWNMINKEKYLQPGQSLTLFVDVTKS